MNAWCLLYELLFGSVSEVRWRDHMTKESVSTAIATLTALGDTFDGDSFDWQSVRRFQLLNHCATRGRPPSCGKILAHAKGQISAFRESIGVRLCVFKVGVTANPIRRYVSY